MPLKKNDLIKIDELLFDVESIIARHAYKEKYRLDNNEDVLYHNIKQFRISITEKITKDD